MAKAGSVRISSYVHVSSYGSRPYANGSVELTLVYNDGRTAGPWHGQYKLDGDTLTIRIVDRSFLWWDYPYEMALYGGGLNLRRVTAVACGR